MIKLKIAFYLSTAFTVLIAMFVQDASILPFLAASLLTGYQVYAKKDVSAFVIALSIIMVLVNIQASLVDVLAWLVIGILSYKK